MARTLERCLRANDVIPRIGGHEFPVIAVATEGEAATRCPASELAATLREQTILTSGRDQIVHAA